MPGTHISRLATKSGALLEAMLIEGGLKEARRWHHNIQLPYIAPRPKKVRLDRKWNWPRLITWTPIVERLRSRNTVFLQLNVPLPEGGRTLPVGQILLSDGFPYFPAKHGACVFLWYLAAAPKDALAAYGLPADLQVMKPLVDAAIQFSFQRGYEGRLTLHAATSGDDQADATLSNIYQKNVGLTPYAGSLKRISLFRKNDGRYFYADEKLALDLTRNLDNLR